MAWTARTSTERTPTSLDVVCLTPAGSGAGFFHPWFERAPPSLRLHAIQLPGHESRLSEAPKRTMRELVASLTDEIAPLLARPHVLLGYSFGALVAFELCRELSVRGGTTTRGLVLCALAAPERWTPRRPVRELDDTELTRRIAQLGGTDAQVLANPELLEVVLPAVRADYGILDDYRFAREPMLDCPILVYHGDRDREVGAAGAAGWQHVTRGAVEVRTWEGEHFVTAEQARAVLDAIATWASSITAEEPKMKDRMRDKADRLTEFLGRTNQFGVALNFADPDLAEAVGYTPAKFLIFNSEHTMVSTPRDIVQLQRVADLFDLVSIVKLASANKLEARDAFDAGVDAVLVPFVESADQVEEFNQAVRFPPLGTRGFCPTSRSMGHAAGRDKDQQRQWVQFQNEQALVIPIIETVEGTAAADEILAAECVKVVCLGSLDLAINMGVSMFDPDGFEHVRAQAKEVIAKAHARGKKVFTPWLSPPTAEPTVIGRLTAIHHCMKDLGADYWWGPIGALITFAVSAFANPPK